jgi:serine/threonine protein kinase
VSTGEIGATANSYEVLAKLAAGGMAEIFLARGANTTGVERYVVLKRIVREKAGDTRFVQMFLEEARLAAQLQHANIAQVYDLGKLGDSYFFTMEYVHGETVRSLLERSYADAREIPIGVVLSVLAGAAAGLQHAHTRIGVGGAPLAIVHRDVSPSNLIVSYEGIVKVVDFGVAKAATSVTETRAGVIKGKAAYMSPEQARSEPLDRRSDLFSLGIVAWEMLTTQRLFTGASDFEIMSTIVRTDAPPPSSVRAGIPPELDALVLRLLARSREARFQSADDVIEALEAVATRIGHQLSAKALGRYIRETFGTRPEPWLELPRGDELDVVSVTSEPLAEVDDLDAPTVAVDSLRNVAATPAAPLPVQLAARADVLAQVPSLRPRATQRGFAAATPPPPAPPIHVAPPAVVAPPPRRRRTWLVVLGLVLLGAAVGAAIALGQ